MATLDTVSVLLVIATPLSYIPQYARLYNMRSSSGISLTASLLLALAAQVQVFQMYYLFALHPNTMYGDVIPWPIMIHDWISLAQVIVQWACTILLFILVVALPSTQAVDQSTSSASTTNHSSSISGRTALFLLALHAIVCLWFVYVAGESLGRLDNIFFLIIMEANSWIAIPLSTIASLFALVAQTTTVRLSPKPNALSHTSLALKSALFLALAALWPFRLNLTNIRTGEKDVSWALTEYYPTVGWASVNNAIVALGQYVVLYVAATTTSSTPQRIGEREALLST